MSTMTIENRERLEAQSREARRKKRWNNFLHMVGNHSLLITLSVIFIMPLYLVIVLSLMNKGQAETRSLWPHPFVWHNYIEIFTAVPFLKWTLNTLFVSLMGTLNLLFGEGLAGPSPKRICEQPRGGIPGHPEQKLTTEARRQIESELCASVLPG